MKKLLIISVFFLTIVSVSTIGYGIVSAKEEIDGIQEQITYQDLKIEYLTPYGYTLDNPNIILNPYGYAPLTAMILFETEDMEEVTITVLGKDQDTTYTNTYSSTNKHIIPIYGLYPDYENKIEIICGNTKRIYTIKTEKLPSDLEIIQTSSPEKKLTIKKNNNYIYALDKNNDIRWYITKNTTYEPYYLENGHFLLALDSTIPNGISTSLIEIDLTGKIYKQYYLENGYYGSVLETENTYLVLSKNLIELDKQTGHILNEYKLKNNYTKINNINKETDTLTISSNSELLYLNLVTKEQKTLNNLMKNNSEQLIINPYKDSNNYQITKGIKIKQPKETKQSKENIFLINYKKIDDNYKKYNIKINQTTDNIQITHQLSNNDKAYLILDKFLDKRVYDLTGENTIINNQGLSGKYSIYIKINDIIYKTNTYINI